jgi:hypothetical protein
MFLKVYSVAGCNYMKFFLASMLFLMFFFNVNPDLLVPEPITSVRYEIIW